MSKLVLYVDDGSTIDIPLDQERITIGRRADNDVCLPNLAVSGEHSAVVTILDDSFLEDLGSTNGTLVNGNAIVKHFLRDRDEIDVGRHKFVYYADDHQEPGELYRARGMKAAAGDLGEQVALAKPIVRSKRAATGGQSHVSATSRGTTTSTRSRVPKSARASEPRERADATPEVLIPPMPKPSVKILAGRQAGRDIPLTKDETTIGRAGVQVAVISQTGDMFRLKPIEGDAAPLLNGEPAAADGVNLSPGDIIDIAGSKLEFVYRD